MNIAILLFFTILIYAFGAQQWRKNWRETKEKNDRESMPVKRWFNWGWQMLWPAYVLVFATGLWVNNLILN